MIENMSDALEAIGLSEYVVHRHEAPTYTKGKLVHAEVTETRIQALAHPASGKDVERLPEGQRTRETIVVITPGVLRAAEAGGAKGDLIHYEGEWFEVQTLERWTSLAGFCRALAQRISQ